MQVRDEFSETTAPLEMLDQLGKLSLVKDLPFALEAGTDLFSVPIHKPGQAPRSRLAEFRPSSIDAARFANRMSPADVSMFCAALDENTALVETFVRSDCGPTEASTELRTTRDPYLLDLVNLLDVPAIFDDDTANLERASLSFLHAFTLDLTRPVEKHGREHVGYVPSQIVTEFVRYRFPGKADLALHGIRYRCSRRDGDIGCVRLYADEDIVDHHGLGQPLRPRSTSY